MKTLTLFGEEGNEWRLWLYALCLLLLFVVLMALFPPPQNCRYNCGSPHFPTNNEHIGYDTGMYNVTDTLKWNDFGRKL